MSAVLVVDTNAAVLQVAKAMLDRRAFEVVTAGSGEEAFKILEKGPEIDLVLSEVNMPGLTGPELIRGILQRFPSMAAVLMTGFTDRPINIDVPVLQKPFTTESLIRRVEEALAASGRANLSLSASVAAAAHAGATVRRLGRELGTEVEQARANTRQSRRGRARWHMRPGAVPARAVVLLMAQVPMVRATLSRSFESRGLCVLEAAETGEALDLMCKYQGRIHVLVSDSAIPEIAGQVPVLAIPAAGDVNADRLLADLERLLARGAPHPRQ